MTLDLLPMSAGERNFGGVENIRLRQGRSEENLYRVDVAKLIDADE